MFSAQLNKSMLLIVWYMRQHQKWARSYFHWMKLSGWGTCIWLFIHCKKLHMCLWLMMFLMRWVFWGRNFCQSHSIIAYWPKSLEGSNSLSASSCECRAGEVQYFFHHTVAMMHPGKPEFHVTHIFAYVHWYENHPYQDTQLYPMKIYTNITRKSGPSVFLPLSRIMNQCAESKHNTEVWLLSW